jgi:hypothetical protein
LAGDLDHTIGRDAEEFGRRQVLRWIATLAIWLHRDAGAATIGPSKLSAKMLNEKPHRARLNCHASKHAPPK